MGMLTERQLFLFQVLVNDYIRSAEPVGSRSISKRDDVAYSPATIRNELADLEEMGFLEKPHSSSGRIPSQQGYRYYVDHLLSPVLLTDNELKDIRSILAEKKTEMDRLIQKTAEILSNFTSYTAIVMGPELLDTRLKHIQIVALSSETAVLIIITNTGHVENRTISIPPGVDAGDIEKIVNVLNSKLQGIPLYQLESMLQTEVARVIRANDKNYRNVMIMLNQAIGANQLDHIYYGGKTNILSQPEFKDINKVLPLLNILEKKEVIYKLLRPSQAGIHVKIGSENQLSAIKNCSIITATYSFGGANVGTVAIVGPTRMEYPRVVSLLDVVTRGLSQVLTKRYEFGS